MAGHHHRDLDVGRVAGEIGNQRFAESLHRELGGAVGRVGAVRAQGRPEAVDAARVHHVRVLAGEQQRHEGAGAVVDAEPADVERALPLVAFAAHEAGAAADAGVVEQQVDVVGVVFGLHRVAELGHLVFVRHVAVVDADDAPLRGNLFAQPLRFGEVVVEHVAGGDVAAFGDQLPAERPPHARSAAGDHRQFAAEVLHCVLLAAPSRQAVVVSRNTRRRRCCGACPWR